jgi:hypothetical protein
VLIHILGKAVSVGSGAEGIRRGAYTHPSVKQCGAWQQHQLSQAVLQGWGHEHQRRM